VVRLDRRDLQALQDRLLDRQVRLERQARERPQTISHRSLESLAQGAFLITRQLSLLEHLSHFRKRELLRPEPASREQVREHSILLQLVPIKLAGKQASVKECRADQHNFKCH
jgi:hypothetical protein